MPGQLPPGPSPLPILGNLHQLSELPHRTFKDFAEKYGSVMSVLMGSVRFVVVSSSDAAKHFLKTHDRAGAGRPYKPALGGVMFNAHGLIIAPYGDRWRQLRRLSTLHMFSVKKVLSSSSIREEHVNSMISSLWDHSNGGNVAVNVSDVFLTMTANVSLQMLIGRSYTADKSVEMKRLLHEIDILVGLFNVGDIFPSLGFLDLRGINRRSERLKKKVFSIFEKVVAEREAKFKNGEEREILDMVDALIDLRDNDTRTHMTDEDVKTVMLDLYAAGADSTATALTWAMAELIRHPHVITKLRKEIASIVGEDGKVDEDLLREARYLDCVIKESLRLHPPAALGVAHESLEAMTVMGHYVPPQTRILYNYWAIGRDSKIWSEENEFIPERFMDEENIDLTGMRDFKMLPFGAGRRACPGYVVALPLMRLAIARLVWDLDWVVEGGPSSINMEEVMGITFNKKTPLHLIPKLN